MKSRHGKCQAGLLVQPSARRRLFPVGFSPVLCWHKVVKRCFICSTAPYLFIVLQNSLWTFSYGEMTSQPCYRIRSLHPQCCSQVCQATRPCSPKFESWYVFAAWELNQKHILSQYIFCSSMRHYHPTNSPLITPPWIMGKMFLCV